MYLDLVRLAAGTTCGGSKYFSVTGIIVLLIGGVIIGLLGKFLAPGGRDNIPLWLTIVCGIVGMLLGNYVYTLLGGSCNTSGIDWLRHLTQVIVAAILVVIAAAATGRTGRRA